MDRALYNNNSIQFFIYLRAELNSQWSIIKSARIQTAAAIRQHGTKRTKTKDKKNKQITRSSGKN
jgi:hypothetical protein